MLEKMPSYALITFEGEAVYAKQEPNWAHKICQRFRKGAEIDLIKNLLITQTWRLLHSELEINVLVEDGSEGRESLFILKKCTDYGTNQPGVIKPPNLS